jgi:hypothetical protein
MIHFPINKNSLYSRFILFKFMAWGIWNKILNGIKTGFNIVRKVLPIATKIGRGVSDALGPGSKIGGFIGKATDYLDKGSSLIGGGSGKLRLKPL